MKKIIFFIWIGFASCFAQKELWTVSRDNVSILNGFGTIAKFDINAMNGVAVHSFDGINGKYPKGKLFQASNGKLYGMCSFGGIIGEIGANGENGFGVLYEYDLILSKYKVIHYYNQNEATNLPKFIGFIEPIPGKIYSAIGNRVFYINIATDVLTFCTGTTENKFVAGKLMKASNGNLYGTTKDSYCQFNNISGYGSGGLFKVNLQTNTVSMIFDFFCNPVAFGIRPITGLIEGAPGKLYGITEGGGSAVGPNLSGYGTIFELNITNNVFTKKIVFDGPNLGFYPYDLIDASNDKLLGVCIAGGSGINSLGESSPFGTIFEYTPSTNTIVKKLDCVSDYPLLTATPGPVSLTKLTNGLIVGNFNYNQSVLSGQPFFYNSITNQTITNNYENPSLPFGSALFNISPTEPFIEICRKPSYQEIIVNTFAPAVGSTFTYNIQNTNATTYVWKKGTTVLSAQTTGILNLPSVTTSDTGLYTCTMTNECGTTVTANLNINVTNLAVETVDDYKSQISLYPNPTKGILNLKFPENRGLKGYNYKITNLLGQIIEEKDISTSGKNELTINTTSYANGVYQVTLVTDKGNWNGKFVKE